MGLDPRSIEDIKWEIWASMYFGGTGRWPTKPEKTIPTNDTKPRENHVRNAVRANL
jgi:hypothetical protein